LLVLAEDHKTDLLVMGCYGHSRYREILLGGVSRTVLRRLPLPVLLAH
jgi:nucleotide-binding universal stress UspA family protein